MSKRSLRVVVAACAALSVSASQAPLAEASAPKGCSEGDAAGCREAGLAYATGRGVARDFDQAEQLLKKACAAKDAEACYDLFYLYAERPAPPPRRSDDRTYAEGCAAGVINDCAGLGRLHLMGMTGGAPDPRRARELFTKACDAGDGEGCFGLAGIYDLGLGVPRDRRRSAALLGALCGRSQPEACQGLGLRYKAGFDDDGAGWKRAGLELDTRACKAGLPAACAALADYTRVGLPDIKKDEVRAAALYDQACAAGLARGCQELGGMYKSGAGVAPDPARGIALIAGACEAGRASACESLASAYSYGSEATPRDQARAAAFYQKACEGGEASSCLRLARLHAEGSGMPRDPARAAALRLQACQLADARACVALGEQYESGDGVGQDTARAAALFRRGCEGLAEPERRQHKQCP